MTPTPTRRGAALVAASLAFLLTVAGFAAAAGGSRDRGRATADAPLVLGHRGASGLRPEHTLASYELAARLGADYIEPDLVATKDDVLVARHENDITGTTNVAARPEFAARKTTKKIDGVDVTGWFTEDFTLAELKTLRAKERLPAVRQRNTIFDGRFQIPTLQEVIDLSRKLTKELGRPIGIIPETKHPTYFAGIGHDLTPLLVRTLKANRLDDAKDRVFVQSFETANLRAIHKLLPRTKLVQLTSASGQPYDFTVAGDKRTYAAITTPAGLKVIANYAEAIGPDKAQIVPRKPDGSSAPATSLVADAHRAGLKVTPYTFRPENQFLPLERRSSADPNAYGDLIGELQQYLALGVDGFFTDNPDIGVEAVRSR
ncbi:Glycerophosphodiester phosphodiesterase, periplasmic [Paraconexibacter sp. AEG42_29]|uniref:glycerophosphodiester phosphodiesterase n=1 Tax=Paraconexibacter sp. AEG42_29 TaxID=2997339 RepID=A0AAU7ATE8_9ACTN